MAVVTGGAVVRYYTQFRFLERSSSRGYGPVHLATFAPDGERLFLVDRGTSTAVAMNARTGFASLVGTIDRDARVAAAPGTTLLYAASADGTVREWDWSLGRETRTVRLACGPVVGLRASSTGTRLAVVDRDRSLTVWDVAGEPQLLWRSNEPCTGYPVGLSSDDRLLAVENTADEAIEVWDLDRRVKSRTLDVRARSVRCAAFLRSTHALVVGFQYAGGHVTAWDADTGEVAFVLDGPIDIVTALASTPDGEYLAAAATGGRVLVWHVPTRALVARFRAYERDNLAEVVAFSDDGTRLATVSSDYRMPDRPADAVVKIWSVKYPNRWK